MPAIKKELHPIYSACAEEAPDVYCDVDGLDLAGDMLAELAPEAFADVLELAYAYLFIHCPDRNALAAKGLVSEGAAARAARMLVAHAEDDRETDSALRGVRRLGERELEILRVVSAVLQCEREARAECRVPLVGRKSLAEALFGSGWSFDGWTDDAITTMVETVLRQCPDADIDGWLVAARSVMVDWSRCASADDHPHDHRGDVQ